MHGTNKQALWFPLFSDQTIRYTLGLVGSALAVLVFWLPPVYDETAFRWFKTFTEHLRYAQSFGAQSDYPFIAEVTFSLAVFAAIVLGIATAFAKINLQVMRGYVATRSVASRLVTVAVFSMVLAIPFILEFAMSERFLTAAFFERALTDKFFLLFWVEGVFITTFFATLFLLFEITNGINCITRILKK